MGISPPPGFDPNSPLTGIWFAVQLGVGARSAPKTRRLMLLGNMRSTGTATPEQPVQVFSPDDGTTKTGAGSELDLGLAAVFAQKKDAEVWICPVAEGGSAVKALGVVVFANNAGTAGVVRVVIAGQLIAETAVAAGDTPTTIAAAVAATINAVSSLPVTAGASTGTLTLTAKQGGPRGNEIAVQVELTTTTTTAALNGGTASATIVRGRLGTGSGGATAGSVADSFVNALAAIASDEWVIVAACTDQTNINRVRDHIAQYAGIPDLRRQQGIVALKMLDVAGANAIGVATNSARVQIVYARDANAANTVVDPWTPSTMVVAASVGAARLYGDGQVGGGGTVLGEITYVAANLDGCQLGGVRAPTLIAANLLGTELASVLNSGLTPLVPSAVNPGYRQLYKSITSYCRDGSSNPTKAVHDTSKVTIPDFAAQRFTNRVRADFPNKNLVPEPATPRPPNTPNSVQPSMVKAAVLDEAFKMEGEDILVNVELFADAMVVEVAPSNPGTLLGQFPIDCIDHLHAMAATVQQTG